MTVRLQIRGYGDGHLIFKERVECEEEDLQSLAEEHTKLLLQFERNMVEIEFLDEPDPLQRFFRFGTDASMMRDPIGIKL